MQPTSQYALDLASAPIVRPMFTFSFGILNGLNMEEHLMVEHLVPLPPTALQCPGGIYTRVSVA